MPGAQFKRGCTRCIDPLQSLRSHLHSLDLLSHSREIQRTRRVIPISHVTVSPWPQHEYYQQNPHAPRRSAPANHHTKSSPTTTGKQRAIFGRWWLPPNSPSGVITTDTACPCMNSTRKTQKHYPRRYKRCSKRGFPRHVAVVLAVPVQNDL